ncbi:MAG: hypothetical protein HRT94_08320 [Alphaproteobacteria bacterium]|nr:hypothetical protein [Alphaproteobacteria bacterium]
MSFLQKPVQLMDGASRVLHGVSTSVGTRRLLGQVAANDGTDPQALLRLIDALKTREKIDSNKRAVFSRLRDSLSQDVLEFAMLHHVSANSEDMDLHRAILEKEAVHKPVGGIEELVDRRFGRPDQTKDCQTLVIPHAAGRRLIGQILRFKFAIVADVDGNGGAFVDLLPGNVDDVIAAEITDLTGNEDGIGYYSISADFNVKSAGEELKFRLVEANPKNHLETTISPIRELFMPDKGGFDRSLLNQSDDDIRRAVLGFIQQRKDIPSTSHLGSGAFVGWIHINRESERDPIIVNYIYDRSLLEHHKSNYRNGVLPISRALLAVQAHTRVPTFVISPSQRIAERPSLMV